MKSCMGHIMLCDAASISSPAGFNLPVSLCVRCDCSWEAVEATFPAVGWIRNYNIRECLTVCTNSSS